MSKSTTSGLLNPAGCWQCYPQICSCQAGPTDGMTKEEVWAALDRGEMACCADCGAKVKTPLPDDWVWDSPEMRWWAWCPKCNLHISRPSSDAGETQG